MKSTTLLNPLLKSRTGEKEKPEDDFFDPLDVSWKSVLRAHVMTPLDNVTMSFYINVTEGKYVSKQMAFKLSQEITEKLKWKDGDRVSLFYDEKDLTKMMLVKSADGYVLRQQTFTKGILRPFFRVTVRANFLGNEEPFRNQPVKSKIDQGRLLLKADF